MERYSMFIFIFFLVCILFLFVFSKKFKKNYSSKQKLSKSKKNDTTQIDWQKQLQNDAERITSLQIEELITKLNLSSNILVLFRGQCDDEIMKKYHLDTDFSVPKTLYLTKQQQDIFFIDRYLPILSYHDKIFVYDVNLKGFNWY